MKLLGLARFTVFLWHFDLHYDPKQCCDNTKLDCPVAGMSMSIIGVYGALWVLRFMKYEANEFAFSLFKSNTYLLIMLKQRHEFNSDVQISWNCFLQFYFINDKYPAIILLLCKFMKHINTEVPFHVTSIHFHNIVWPFLIVIPLIGNWG